MVKINKGDVGYPSKSLMHDIYLMGGYVPKCEPQSRGPVIMGDLADEMNGKINQMKLKHPSWAEAIYFHYTTRVNKRKLANELGISTRTLRERTQRGKEWLSERI